MQAAAQQIMTDFGGQFPNTYEGISCLKGIGPYTAGAISSIAFNLPEPAVDGNVMRVWHACLRLIMISEFPAIAKFFRQ